MSTLSPENQSPSKKNFLFKSLKFWGIVLAILSFIGLLAFGLTSDPSHVPSPWIGKPAPDFAVVALDGASTLRLSDLKGKPVVLNFWASWCVECQVEAGILEGVYQQFEKQKNQIHVVGIAIQDTHPQAQAFAQRFGKSYFLALDDATGTIGLDYGLYGVPETFFIDARGVVRFKHVGAVTTELMAKQIQSLLQTSQSEGASL